MSGGTFPTGFAHPGLMRKLRDAGMLRAAMLASGCSTSEAKLWATTATGDLFNDQSIIPLARAAAWCDAQLIEVNVANGNKVHG